MCIISPPKLVCARWKVASLHNHLMNCLIPLVRDLAQESSDYILLATELVIGTPVFGRVVYLVSIEVKHINTTIQEFFCLLELALLYQRLPLFQLLLRSLDHLSIHGGKYHFISY